MVLTKADLYHGQWYAAARSMIVDKYRAESDLFIDILAASSPRVSVSRNWRLAERIFADFKAGKELDITGILPIAIPNIRRALAGEALSGNKVSRFAANLRGNLDKVTIDTWICKYYNIQQETLTDKVYKKLELRIRRAAKRHNLAPAEYQAIIWQRARIAFGYKAISFASNIDRTPTFWNLS